MVAKVKKKNDFRPVTCSYIWRTKLLMCFQNYDSAHWNYYYESMIKMTNSIHKYICFVYTFLSKPTLICLYLLWPPLIPGNNYCSVSTLRCKLVVTCGLSITLYWSTVHITKQWFHTLVSIPGAQLSICMKPQGICIGTTEMKKLKRWLW